MGIDIEFVNHTKKLTLFGQQRWKFYPERGGLHDAWVLAWLTGPRGPWHRDHVTVERDMDVAELEWPDYEHAPFYDIPECPWEYKGGED